MQESGISLLELVISILLVSVLLGLGVPGLRWVLFDMRLTADVNALVTSIQLARSESAKLGDPVVVCKTVDFIRCGGPGVHYESGWMVFANTDQDSPPRRDAGERVLYQYVPWIRGSIRSNRVSYVFRPYYRRSTNGTITFCDERGAAAARAIIVSYTGRPRTARVGPGGRPLTCAA